MHFKLIFMAAAIACTTAAPVPTMPTENDNVARVILSAIDAMVAGLDILDSLVPEEGGSLQPEIYQLISKRIDMMAEKPFESLGWPEGVDEAVQRLAEEKAHGHHSMYSS